MAELKILLAVFIFFFGIQNCHAQSYVVKPGTSANLRSGKSTNTSIITSIPANTEVKLLKKGGTWWQVEYNGKTGYILSSLLIEKQVEIIEPEKKIEHSHDTLAIQKLPGKQIVKDTAKSKIDTSTFWINKTDYIIIGSGIEHRTLDVIFKNTTANFIGNIYSATPITDWKFTPSVNQVNASIFITTKFTSYAFYKAINPIGNTNTTKLTAFNFSQSVKKFTFTLKYLKYKGLLRTEPVYNTTTFFKDITFTPFSLMIEYHVGRLRNNSLHIPIKTQGVFAFGAGYASISISNPTDFIPALQYVTSVTPPDSIIAVNNTYLKKFRSRGFGIPLRYDCLLMLIKPKSLDKPKVLYLKFGIYYLLNYQRFNYESYSNSLNNTQYNKYQNGKGTTWSMQQNAALVYDCGRFYVGTSATYFNYAYGYANDGVVNANLGPLKFQVTIKETSKGSGVDANNHVEDIRATYNGFIGFRLNFKKQYTKIDNGIMKVKSKFKRKK